MMERKQREWVSRFGAKMRADRAFCVDEPLPTAIATKLRALKDLEQRQRVGTTRSFGSSPRTSSADQRDH